MHAGTKFAIAALLAVTIAATGAPPPIAARLGDPGDDALFAATASEILSRDFTSADVSYLLLDVRSGALITSHWENSDELIPVGSLVKPFTALAYAEAHRFRFPEHTCLPGTCWLPRGHGRLGIVQAVAVSCNSYFAQLASGVNASQVGTAARRFGLEGPGVSSNSEALIGMHGTWRESPLAIARAYAELLGRRSQPGIREIVKGMQTSAKNGTAAGVSKGSRWTALAKTGTAPCTHKKRAPGDGFVIVAWPADAPHYLLLVREHGKPGAQAAILAGRMLRALDNKS